jgi:hypothetical protein
LQAQSPELKPQSHPSKKIRIKKREIKLPFTGNMIVCREKSKGTLRKLLDTRISESLDAG